MAAKFFSYNNKYFRFFLLVLIFLAGSLICYAYFQNFILTEPIKNLDAMMAGTYHKPYVMRQLSPLVIRILQLIIPLPAIQIGGFIMWLSLLGFIYSLRYLYLTFWKPSIMLEITSFVALFGLGIMFAGNKIYDLPGLFLFTLCLGFLARLKFFPYLLLFPLAVLNKETAVLLILVFVLWIYPILDRYRFVIYSLIQFITFGLIRLVLAIVFTDNAGSLFEIHWMEFLEALVFYPAISLAFGLLLFIFLYFCLRNFAHRPIFLQRAFIAVLPVQFILYFLVGYPFELRFFMEAYPIVVLFLVQPISRMFKVELVMKHSFLQEAS